MDMIRIARDKLKISMTERDMCTYFPGTPKLDCRVHTTQQAVRCLLQEVQNQTDFDARGRRVYLQFFPSRCGGGELFVTCLQENHEAKDTPAEKAPLPIFLPAGVTETQEQQPKAEAEEQSPQYSLFVFSAMEHLLSVCAYLQMQSYRGESTAWKGEDNRKKYYLLLTQKPLLPHQFSHLSEYGAVTDAIGASEIAKLMEYGQLIRKKDAISVLAPLANHYASSLRR